MTKTAAAAEPAVTVSALNDLYLATEAPKGVNLVVRNSSSGSPLTDAELKASIFHNGLIHPLIFKAVEGKRYVVAGNRRLRMLREIFAGAEDSQLAQLVKVQNVDDFESDWRQIALDSNLSLPPHIVERYEQIVLLAKDLKLSPEDVQLRFGLNARQYNQVMALGKMSPTVREAWKAGEMDAKTAQVFTLEPDHKEQDKIFAAAKKNSHNGELNEYHVRGRIIPSTQREVGKLVAFVGVDTVRKAKLLKIEDMFNDNHTVTDVKALNKLAGDKMEAKCRELRDEDGWSWATPTSQIQDRYQHGTLSPTKGSFSNEQKKKAGCFVGINHEGEFEIEYGKLKPAERKSVEATARSKKIVDKKKAKVKAGEVPLTNALAERLSQQLEKAVSASLNDTPHVAVAALIAAFASDGHVLDVSIGGQGRNSYGKTSSEKNFAQVFEGAMKATPESRIVMLCKIAAEALSIEIHNTNVKFPSADAGVQALISEMDMKSLNHRISVEFDVKDYFDSVNLQACVEAVRAAMGDGPAAEVAKMKKAAAAKFAADHVVKAGWLPKELRTIHYRGPADRGAAAAPKPAKKAAKKAAKKGKK